MNENEANRSPAKANQQDPQKLAGGSPQGPSTRERDQSHTGNVIEGIAYPRVRYGEEKIDGGADQHPCPDCGAAKGQFHVFGCELDECPRCGDKVHNCDCPFDEAVLEPGGSLAILAKACQIESVTINLATTTLSVPLKPSERTPD